ncbi:FAD-dependent monooxygenase [Streptomyces sp. URMC 123]|uniref:FAD-dependent monooxygenase n=1 Tax=Streptomyces sp. URMC 123 TaxID=3423403 RepID=UPI003F1E1FDB
MSKIVIVGGGIGGLAAALSVARRGHHAVVLEQADRFAEIGAGIQLAPNGIHALERLGLGDGIRDRAVHMDELRFMDGVTGRYVAGMPLGESYVQRFGNPYVVVHRADLHTLLLDACLASDAIELHSGKVATGYEQDGRQATVLLADGGRFTGDAVIGADGIRSAVRRRLVGDGDPRISGITVYRAIVPMERVPEELRWNSVAWWAGPKCHLVHYPIAGGTYLNLAASHDNGAREALAGVPVTGERVMDVFSALGEDARRLMRLGDDWRSWVLVDRDPVEYWTDGRVTLLGDAAHPMLHYVAQGACQGLEDAVVLGDLLDCGPDEIPQRLEKYNAARRDRTARIQLLARRSIELWHPVGEAAERRNALLASYAPSELHDVVAWMHGNTDFGASAPTSFEGVARPRPEVFRPQ